MIKQTDPDIPVILLTGLGDMMLAKDERVGNMAVVVDKPITLAGLREALAKAVDISAGPLEIPAPQLSNPDMVPTS